MLDYDREADRYDASRGGEARAEAAAAAYAGLLAGVRDGPVLDLACGTGIVTVALARRSGRPTVGLDSSSGMLSLAARRLPRRTVLGDAGRLPFTDAGLAAVTAVWLLHLLPPSAVDAVLSEVARVLCPGGRFLTTVDKNRSGRRDASDFEPRTVALARPRGLVRAGGTSFVGVGQGRGDRPDPVYRVLALARQPG